MEVRQQNFQTTKKERFGFYGYFFGQNMILMLVSMYFTIYCTTVLGISAGAVGTIILISKIWDAINDPMLSALVEKTNFKSGKFLPWVRSMSIALPLSTVLIFSFSGALIEMSMFVRILYASIFYTVWGMVYTVSDSPAYAMCTIMTTDQNEKNNILSISRVFSMLGIFIFLVLATPLLNLTKGNWMLFSLILSIVAGIGLYGINLCKERVTDRTVSPTLKQIFGAMFSNRYIVILIIVLFVAGVFNLQSAVGAYVAYDVFKSPELLVTTSLISMFPMLIVATFMPQLLKKFDKATLYKIAYLGLAVFGVLQFFVGYDSVTTYLIITFAKGIVIAPSGIATQMLLADTIVYQEYETGERFETLAFVAGTFAMKTVAALASAFGLWLLDAIGYVSSTANETVVQTQQVVDGIWIIANLTPVIGGIAAFIIMHKFYDLTQDKVSAMAEEIQARKQKANATN